MYSIFIAGVWLMLSIILLVSGLLDSEDPSIAFWAMLILANMWLIHSENKR